MIPKDRYDVCVIGGGGHVGLPLSIAFADKGKNTVIFDINASVLEMINGGMMPFLEKGADEVLRRVIGKTLTTSLVPSVIREAKFVVVVIGTPVDEHLNPAFGALKQFFDEIVPYLHDEQILILRSTLFPGITEKVQRIIKRNKPGVEVCFCPERILEGKSMDELSNLPQIVSGFSADSVKAVIDLFSLLTKDIIVTTPLEAELAKLFNNSLRYIQFAAANQFYMIAEEYGADFSTIHHAMTHHYPRAKGFPKPGFAAGPCLFKDTMQISAFSNNKFFLGHSAMLINEGLPNFIIEQLKKKYELHEKNVAVLGMAFKAESDDKRESLSYKLKKILEIEAKSVICSDEYIVDPRFVSVESAIASADIVIIGAPHNRYYSLNFNGKVLIDVWNCTKTTNMLMTKKEI